MRSLPPLAQLRAFEAAARRLSFRLAAEELGVTPTAISHQVRELETYCGGSLFRRRPRPLTLTDAGARLYPTVRDGLDAFAAGLADIRQIRDLRPLRVTTTNAFASRWLVPRLPAWRAAHPGIRLEVIGTDVVLDLRSDECDLAIRCAETPPAVGEVQPLLWGEFLAVCSTKLLPGGEPLRNLADLRHHTLIHYYWSPAASHPGTWRWWLNRARSQSPAVPELSECEQLSFREELHAIDAVLAGQGIAIIHDVLIAKELETGALTRAVEASAPGPGYFLTYDAGHPRRTLIEHFGGWVRAQADAEMSAILAKVAGNLVSGSSPCA
jgi:LysR family transcriptional regulator, glycine cleavage system transcriptional activator